MGTCLGKLKPKRNRVCPSNIEAEIRRRLLPPMNAGRQKGPDKVNPVDMKKQLEAVDVEDSKMTKGGVSFTLDFNEGNPSRLPSRLADRLDEALTPPEDIGEIKYTSEEREMFAELLRNDILREKSDKARRNMHAYDAARRRGAHHT